ncbi:cardioacceleratory peptide receptor-like isoform X2 [Mercenaria mercenaria]|uniref:cardioacceleratory peptide receptor-like isoform X2 n=1 Tax=Mercenaria mercenaria TaxID=6596 RepID=UPI00234F92A5|nr:cardioacceleratory peptide receptor-like isoform X2 [Mercenaria mercenaria]
MEVTKSSVLNCTGYSCQNDTMLNLISINDTYADYFYVDIDVTFWQVPQLIILIVLFVFIVFGNVCVLVAIGLSNTGRKTRMNFFIVNLAISDLTVGVFHVTVDIAERCLVEWYGGPALCKIVRFLQVLVVYASTFMIVSLSIDRVDAIARPMNFTRKATTVRALVNTAWIASGVLSVPSFLLFDTYDHTSGKQYCIMNLHETWHWQLYTTLVALTAFIIPALIIIVCYGIIIFVIWDKGRGFHNAFNASTCRNKFQAADGGNKGIIPQAKIKTIKMTLIIVCVFVFSWCPYFVFNLTDVYSNSNQPKSSTHYAVTSLVQSLAPINSAANPIIYGIFGTSICQNLRRIPCIGSVYKWFCQCRIKRRNFTFRSSQRTSEQTNIDVTSCKYVSVSKQGYRYLLKSNPKYRDMHNLIGRISSHTPNIASQNGTIMKTENHVTHNEAIPIVPTSESKCFYRRRPSGLPLVNRKMTAQETILLETYRSKGEKNCSESDVPIEDEPENKVHVNGANRSRNNVSEHGRLNDVYGSQFAIIEVGIDVEATVCV